MPHRHSRLGPAYNLRGAVFMVLSMAGFAVEDSLLKLAAVSLPPGQVLITFGILGTATFAALSVLAGEPPVTRAMLGRAMVLRSLSEVTGRLFYMLAIALTPLSTASAILQATPLVVMVGAAMLFGESIGPRRWLAVALGFGGVLLILRPGTGAFDTWSAVALLSMMLIVVRDIATRYFSRQVGSGTIAFHAALAVMLSGFVLGVGEDWRMPNLPEAALLLLSAGFLTVGYLTAVATMRVGEISFVAPFRYTSLVWAILLGLALFGEWPDGWTWAGSALVVGAGLYAILRERQLRGRG